MNIDPNQIEIYKKLIPKSTLELLLNPLAKGIGYTTAGLFYAVFGKIAKYGAANEKEINDLLDRTAKKLDKIPKSKQTTNNKGLMLKGFEDSRYSLNDELMREYFSTLIAKAANKNYKDKISPNFSTILSNLSPSDAQFLRLFKKHYEEAPGLTVTPPYYIADGLPLGRVVYLNKARPLHYSVNRSDLVLNKEKIISYSKEIDSCESFGIMKRNYNLYDRRYIKQFEEMKKLSNLNYDRKLLKGEIPNHIVISTNGDQPFNDVEFHRGMINLTQMGKTFLQIVLM